MEKNTKLREARKAKGYTIGYCARRVGVHAVTWGNWETKGTRPHSPIIQKNVCKLLGVEPKQIDFMDIIDKDIRPREREDI